MADAKSTTLAALGRKLIPGYSKYAASYDGVLWSCHGKFGTWHRMNLFRDPVKGYLYVFMRKDDEPRSKHRDVHTLILEAFIGPRPPGMQCCHKDGNPLNNRLDNLRWDTPSSNSRDTVRHGRCNFVKLTPSDVKSIRYLLATKAKRKRIAHMFGVSLACIKGIATGRNWKHVS
jgi:hypothetical protein